MAGKIILILAAFVICSASAAAQQTVSVFGGVQMELQDSYAVSAHGVFASYYQAMSPMVSLGGSIGYSDLKGGWYVPFSSGLQFRPFPLRVSPIFGFEIGTAFRTSDFNADENPMLLSPQIGMAFPLGGPFDVKLLARGDVMTQNSNWWGYVWYSAGVGFSW